MSGDGNRVTGEGQTIREAARDLVQGMAAGARYAGVASVSMRVWVQPGAAGRLTAKTGLGCGLLSEMSQAQVEKLEAYLAAVGYLPVGPCLTVKVSDLAWSEWQVADAIATTVAQWAIARGEAAVAAGEAGHGSRWIALANGAIVEKQAAVDAARRQLAPQPAAPPAPGEVLQDADYDEHVRLVVDRASAETPRRAVRMLAQAERLLARKGRLTAERGAALAQAFAGVVDRASDTRRN